MILSTLALGLLLQQGQEPDRMFSVIGEGAQRRISADQPTASAADALRTLGNMMGWQVDFETVDLRRDLANRSVALAFVDQDPRTIANLIAAAANADVIFDDSGEMGRIRPRANVVSLPSADTESGRARLLKHSVDWYYTFLQDGLAFDPARESDGMRARMELARLLMDRGEFEIAAEQYLLIHKSDRTHEYVPLALLKIAECYFELATEQQTRVDGRDSRVAKAAASQQQNFYDKSETYAHMVTDRHAGKWESAKATVFLGKVMLAQERYSECVKFISANYLRLAGTPEIVDLYILVGTAERARGNTQRVLDAMLTLESALDEFRGMTRDQMLDYLFLRADSLEKLGHHAEAMLTTHEFLGMEPADSRRGAAFVILGRSYLAQDKLLEAWSAAREAHNLRPVMTREWMREEGKFYAMVALEIGDKDEAFERLELEVRDSPESEPELVLYLVEAFMSQGRYEKAIMTARLLVDSNSRWGDEARLATVEAMWKQADASSLMASFPRAAKKYALAIEDEDMQRRVSELFGKAYERSNRIDLAADAYRGIIR